MQILILFLLIIFVIMNLIQLFSILFLKYRMIGIIVGTLEALEFPLMVYLFLTKSLFAFLFVIFIEVLQWVDIAFYLTKR